MCQALTQAFHSPFSVTTMALGERNSHRAHCRGENTHLRDVSHVPKAAQIGKS